MGLTDIPSTNPTTQIVTSYYTTIPFYDSSDYTDWLFNIAMENDPFIDGLPFLKMVIFHGYVK